MENKRIPIPVWKWLVLGLLVLNLIALISTHTFAQTKIKHSYHAMEGTYILLQAADVALTYNGLRAGAKEMNPAMRWAIDNRVFIPAKTVVTVGTLWMFRRIYTENPKLAYIYLIAANLIYSAVVINNYKVTVRLKM